MHYSKISSKKVLAFAPPFSGDVFGSTFCFGMFWTFSFSMPFFAGARSERETAGKKLSVGCYSKNPPQVSCGRYAFRIPGEDTKHGHHFYATFDNLSGWW